MAGRPKGSPNKAGRKDGIRLTLELAADVVGLADARAVVDGISRTRAIEELVRRGARGLRRASEIERKRLIA